MFEEIDGKCWSPAYLFLKLTLREAVTTGARGLRVRPEIDRFVVEYEYEGCWNEVNGPPFRLYSSSLLLLSGAVGIPPDALMPMSVEFDFTARDRFHSVTARRVLDDSGEWVEVVWDRPAVLGST